MGKDLFDNLMKVIKIENIIASTTIVTVEVDFELPRGFVAKIHKVIMGLRNYVQFTTVGDAAQLNSCLVRDPDDITTTQIPVNSVQHDAIMDWVAEILILEVTAVGEIVLWNDGFYKTVDFTTLGMDVITARNMRFNTVAFASTLDGADTMCEIYYTLEEVTDIDILNLLDIL